MKAPTPIVVREWNHTVPSSDLQHYDLQLLTITGISVLGSWCGQVGEFYVGWAPLLNCSRAQLLPSVTHYLSNEQESAFPFQELLS